MITPCFLLMCSCSTPVNSNIQSYVHLIIALLSPANHLSGLFLCLWSSFTFSRCAPHSRHTEREYKSFTAGVVKVRIMSEMGAATPLVDSASVGLC